jgi:TonB family protein
MTDKAVKKSSSVPFGFIAVMVICLAAAVYIGKIVLTDDGPRKKNRIATVTLLKPPPPVVVKEKPPEPIKEIQKKEEIIDPVLKNEEQTPQNADNQDNTPAGDSLGVDAEGGAGSDGFGLVGKKGGRSLLAGGSGKVSLLTKFAGYAQIVTTEIRKKVMRHLDEEGGIPKGRLQAVVRLSVDIDGKVIDYRIIGSSGNTRMDEAVIESLRSLWISEPPPESMPRTMNIKIISQG